MLKNVAWSLLAQHSRYQTTVGGLKLDKMVLCLQRPARNRRTDMIIVNSHNSACITELTRLTAATVTGNPQSPF